MLNNDFDVLVTKYQRYKIQKKKSRNRRLLLLIVIGALAYYISMLNFSTSTKTKDISERTPKQNKTDDINKSKKALHKIIQEENKSKKDKPIIKKETPKKPHEKVSKSKKSALKVTTQGKSLYQLLENQAQSQSYSSTIAVANYYYSHKKYQETIKWAIEASKKNKTKVRPWILYAKSKKAQGKNKIAKKALSLFLKRHQSAEAQALLNSL